MQYQASFTSLYTMTMLVVRSWIVHLTPIPYHLTLSLFSFHLGCGYANKQTKKKKKQQQLTDTSMIACSCLSSFIYVPTNAYSYPLSTDHGLFYKMMVAMHSKNTDTNKTFTYSTGLLASTLPVP